MCDVVLQCTTRLMRKIQFEKAAYFFILREHPTPHAWTKTPTSSTAATDLFQRLRSVRVDHKDDRAGALVHVHDARIQHRQGSSASTCWPERKNPVAAKVQSRIEARARAMEVGRMGGGERCTGAEWEGRAHETPVQGSGAVGWTAVLPLVWCRKVLNFSTTRRSTDASARHHPARSCQPTRARFLIANR